MKNAPWTPEENRALLALYFAMLDKAVYGKSYNKAAMIREVQQHESDDGGPSHPGPLVNRSRGSIEAKLMNASAAHRDLINEHIQQLDSEPLYRDTMATYGYKAWGNYQATLKAEMASIINRRELAAEHLASPSGGYYDHA
jgi:hypothetical protein